MSARDVLADAMNMPRHWPDDVRFKRPDAYLAALSAAGYAVVPREPSVSMLQAGYNARLAARHPGISGQTIEASVRAAAHRELAIYRAMIDSLNAATDRDIERAASEPTR